MDSSTVGALPRSCKNCWRQKILISRCDIVEEIRNSDISLFGVRERGEVIPYEVGEGVEVERKDRAWELSKYKRPFLAGSVFRSLFLARVRRVHVS